MNALLKPFFSYQNLNENRVVMLSSPGVELAPPPGPHHDAPSPAVALNSHMSSSVRRYAPRPPTTSRPECREVQAACHLKPALETGGVFMRSWERFRALFNLGAFLSTTQRLVPPYRSRHWQSRPTLSPAAVDLMPEARSDEFPRLWRLHAAAPNTSRRLATSLP